MKELTQAKATLSAQIKTATKSEGALTKRISQLEDASERATRYRMMPLTLDRMGGYRYWWFDNGLGVEPSFRGDIALLPWTGRLLVEGAEVAPRWAYIDSPLDAKAVLFSLSSRAQRLLPSIIKTLEKHPDYEGLIDAHRPKPKRTRRDPLQDSSDGTLPSWLRYHNTWARSA